MKMLTFLEIENQLRDVFTDPIEVIIKGKMVVLDTIDQKLVFTGTEFGKLLELKNIINVTSLHHPAKFQINYVFNTV